MFTTGGWETVGQILSAYCFYKVLLEHKHDHFFIVYGCFCAIMVELSSYNACVA